MLSVPTPSVTYPNTLQLIYIFRNYLRVICMDEIINQQFQQYIKQGDKDSARKLITQYVKENPNDAEGWYLAAGVAVNKTQRIALLNKVLQIDPLHTKASQVLEKLQDQSASAIPPTNQPSSNYRNLVVVGLVGILIVALASIIFLMLEGRNTNEGIIDIPTRVSVILDTQTPEPTSTPRPTNTPRLTNTPAPTRTPRPTNTPRPTRTPQLGTRENPFPYDYGEGYSSAIFTNELLVVTGMVRGVDSDINAANMFNSKARYGEEWVLVGIVISCLKNSNTTCHYSELLNFHIIDKNGRIYEPKIITGLDSDLDFPSEIYGDTTDGGVIGFIIPISLSERDLLFVYRPSFLRDERYFFELAPLSS